MKQCVICNHNFDIKKRKACSEICSKELRKRGQKRIMREWYLKNREKQLKAVSQYQKTHKDMVRKRRIRYYKKHKEKIDMEKKIRAKAWNIPLKQLCELCPEIDKHIAVERHHFDYEYPKLFISICDSCHWYANRTTAKL